MWGASILIGTLYLVSWYLILTIVTIDIEFYRISTWCGGASTVMGTVLIWNGTPLFSCHLTILQGISSIIFIIMEWDTTSKNLIASSALLASVFSLSWISSWLVLVVEPFTFYRGRGTAGWDFGWWFRIGAVRIIDHDLSWLSPV